MYIDKIDKNIDLDYIKSKLNLQENDVVFISGSLIESINGNFSKNVGNIYSDIDIFIIKDNFENNTHIDYDEGFSQIYFRNINGILMDITVYLKKDIYKLLENINNVELNKNERIKNSLKFPGKWNHRVTNEFLNRFYYSIPIQNEEEYYDIYKSMNFKKFCNLTKQRLIASIDNLQNDIVGNIKSGNLHTSLYCMRELFILFSKVVIYDNYELVDRDKWVLPKLFAIIESKNSKLDFIINLYNDIFFHPKLDEKIQLEQSKKLFLEIDNYILDYEEDLWI